MPLKTPRFTFIIHPTSKMWKNLMAIGIRDKYLTFFTDLMSNASSKDIEAAQQRIMKIILHIGGRQQPKDIHLQLHGNDDREQKFVHVHCELANLKPADLDVILNKILKLDPGFITTDIAKQLNTAFIEFDKSKGKLSVAANYIKSNGEVFAIDNLMDFYILNTVKKEMSGPKIQNKILSPSIIQPTPVVPKVKTVPLLTEHKTSAASQYSLTASSAQAVIELGFLAAAQFGFCANPYRHQEIAAVIPANDVTAQLQYQREQHAAALLKLQKSGTSLQQLAQRCFGSNSDTKMNNFLVRVLNGDVTAEIGHKFNKHVANPHTRLRHIQFKNLMRMDEENQLSTAQLNVKPEIQMHYIFG